jgi:putative bacteriocin precursor
VREIKTYKEVAEMKKLGKKPLEQQGQSITAYACSCSFACRNCECPVSPAEDMARYGGNMQSALCLIKYSKTQEMVFAN